MLKVFRANINVCSWKDILVVFEIYASTWHCLPTLTLTLVFCICLHADCPQLKLAHTSGGQDLINYCLMSGGLLVRLVIILLLTGPGQTYFIYYVKHAR